ncbi:MAG: methylenetetrahydrofolate reductase [Xanthomonadales bacterium]|nr:methylenetetrahydrofolate reductase [Xanthomonadales bacterium]
MIRFRDAIAKHSFAVSADLALGRATTADHLRQQARTLAPYITVLQVPDAHDGRLQMSATAAAAILLSEGIDPLVHVTGRDRNRIALENDLLGLAVLGVDSILLTRGEELPSTYQPVTRQVMELSGEDLVNMARLMGEDESITGAGEFFIGTAATVFVPKKGWQPKSLLARVDAGAHFIQTQICFNMKSMRRYMQHLVDARLTWRCAVMTSLAVLPSAAAALELKRSLQGAVMSDKLVQRISQAADPELEGIKICAEKIQQLREIPGVSGVNLVSAGDPALILAAMEAAGIEKAS